MLKINGTSSFYSFNLVKEISEINNLIVKDYDLHRVVVNFDIVFRMSIHNKDQMRNLNWNDFKHKMEIMLSFCDTWFSNFKIYDTYQIFL